jgi:hypothetical protein
VPEFPPAAELFEPELPAPPLLFDPD